MKKLLVAACVLLVAAAAAAQDTARMEQIIQGYVQNKTFMGTVLVARDGDVVLSKGYGMANLEWDIPNQPSTKFRLGSITKQFTAASILLLEERGKLRTSDPVKKYFAEAPAAWDAITLHYLLTHTSGIPNFTSLPEYNTIKLSNSPIDKTIASFKDKPLDFAPGDRMSYSNSGYLVLGYVVEKVGGVPYTQFLQDNIFTPLAMQDSGYDSNTGIISHRASGYSPGPGGPANAGYVHMSVPHGAGALYSTTEDLLKWEQALFGGKLVSVASLQKMTTPEKSDYAYGLVVVTQNGRKRIVHGGGIEGFNTSMAYYPDSKTAVIVLANLNGSVPDQLSSQLSAVVFGDRVTLTAERKTTTVPAAVLAKYAGAYEMAPKMTLTVVHEDDRLYAQLTGQPRFEIFPESETSFFLKVVDAQLSFVVENDVATHVVLHQNGRDLKGTRRP
jgi:CubicO group peptidase (beta-lactamase class C family)